MEGTRQEIEERAIPFKEGDEVLVHIIEPHMYEVDDAVAKIDGYIISVVNGGRFVGDEEARAHRGGRPHGRRGHARWTPTTPAAADDERGDDDARIEASAPRPQRRTAPFGCQGRSDSPE